MHQVLPAMHRRSYQPTLSVPLCRQAGGVLVSVLLTTEAIAAAAATSAGGRRAAGVVQHVRGRGHALELHVDSSTAVTIEKVNRTSTACGTHTKKHPSEIDCPSDCPFLRSEPTRYCQFKCVAADQCGDDDPLANFANRETNRCEGCRAAACVKCKTAYTCAVCQEGFVLGRWGTCVSPYRYTWWLCYFFVAVLVGTFVLYFVQLALRPTVNPVALEKGLGFRQSSKMHDAKTGLPYMLWRNLTSDTIGGVGVKLHFNFQKLVIAWAAVVCILLFVLSCFFETRPSAMKVDPNTDRAFLACEHDVTQQKEDFAVMEMFYSFAAVLIYIFTTVCSLAAAVYQRRLHQTTTDQDITMEDYMLMVKGLPVMSGDKDCEEEVAAFFQKTFPDLKVVGATCCWDLSDSKTKAWVDERVEEELFSLDVQRDLKDNVVSRTTCVERSQVLDAQGTKCFDPRMRCLDVVFGIGGGPKETPPEPSDEEIKAKLHEMRSTKYAYVVFNTERETKEAQRRSETMKMMFQDAHEVEFISAHVEPDTVLWDGFGTRLLTLVRNIVIGNIVILAAILILDICFYAPYVVYIFMYSDVKGMIGGGAMQGFLLGMLITVCNQIIYLVIGNIADRCGFQTQGTKQRYYVTQYTFAVFFNTCVDLWTVMLLAQGFSVEEVAHKMKDPANAMGEDGALSPKAIAENPSVQRTVYTQLLMYLFPGCLLAPFILEPAVANFLTYWVPKWLVRSREEVDVQEAEQRLACPPFDLSRYGDIIINVMLCVLTLAFTYRDLYVVFLWLLISLVWIYCWDHYRLLRCSQRSFFASPLMEFTAQWLTAVPCAMLAAMIVFHAWAASDDGFLEPVAVAIHAKVNYLFPQDAWIKTMLLLQRKTIVVHMGVAFCAHLVVHWFIICVFVPRWSAVHADHDDMVPYEVTAEKCPCTWFNSNPVHCLRSKYIFDHAPPMTPFLPGKEYLIERNPSIGQHFKETRICRSWSQMPASLMDFKENPWTWTKNILDNIGGGV